MKGSLSGCVCVCVCVCMGLSDAEPAGAVRVELQVHSEVILRRACLSSVLWMLLHRCFLEPSYNVKQIEFREKTRASAA